MIAIGIDIGTTSICALAIDVESGRVIRSETRNSGAFLKGCAEWEKIQSVDKIISIAKGLLDSFLTGDAAVIGVTGQMHGIVYTDVNGKAVSPLYTWQDGRGNQPYRGTTYAGFLNSFSGYGAVTDFYNTDRGIRPKEAVSYCTVHDYFVMQLCGLKKPLIHISDAASFGGYDPEENKLPFDCGGNVVSDYRIAGSYKGLPVSVAIGDNQASVFSSLGSESAILLNVGTGSQVSVISDVPIAAENIETRPFFEGKYLVAGSALCGGRAYSLLKDFFSETLGYLGPVEEAKVYEIMNRMLKKPVKDPLTVDTRFAGTRSDPGRRGSISGIGTENFGPSQLTRGILGGMAEELFSLYKTMNTDRQGIVGSGNGIRKNAALVEMLEEKFGARMVFPGHLEEASYGAALFGLISCDILKNAEQARRLIRYTNPGYTDTFC